MSPEDCNWTVGCYAFLDCESIGERILRSLNGATAGRLRSPVLRHPGFSTGQLPINASLRSHMLYLGRIMSGFEQKAMSCAVLSLSTTGIFSASTWQPACMVSLLNILNCPKT